MEPATSERRQVRFSLACVLAFLILGCATSTQKLEKLSDSSAATISARLDQEVGSIELEKTQPASLSDNDIDSPRARLSTAPRTLLEERSDGIGIQLASAQGSEQVIIETGKGKPTYKMLELQNPARVVIDMPSVAIGRTSKVPVADSGVVESVRTGKFQGAARVVIDLKEGVEASPRASIEGSTIQIALNNPNGDRPNVGINSQSANNSELSGPGAADESNSPVFALPDTNNGPLTVTALNIDSSNRENSATVELSGPVGSFTFRQTAPSEYVLRIPEGALSETAQSTVLSESPSTLIRSARATREGNDLLIRVFSKQEASVTADARGSKIVLSSGFGTADDIRAQAAPEPEKKSEDKKLPPINGVTVKDEKAPAIKEDVDSDSIARFVQDQPRYVGRLISLDLQDTDIDNALRIIAEVSNLNIIASDDVTGKVTLRLIDVPWDQALDVILKTNNLDKVQEGNVVRIAPVEKLRAEREALKQARQAEEELEPTQIRYIRVSYAKASEVKTLLDSVITERGAVAYDERTNQIIVKDIARGIKSVVELISKLDLRTPQILLETQIVEATHSFLRQLGSRLGFRYVQSPETGNASNRNFPNNVDLGGNFSNPVSGSNPISLLLGSADGSKSLFLALDNAETEGRARVVSRPAVATTNNKPATIKSVQKLRIRLPNGGTSIATGQGASANGAAVATEVIEVGIVLDVTPQASPDYYVLLDINAKSSTLGPLSQGVADIPPEIERSATSSVLVSSGQTFALGGIYKISVSDTYGGVPWLKDVPFFGHFFRGVTTDDRDEELLFFITPRIVEGSFDDAAMKTSL